LNIDELIQKAVLDNNKPIIDWQYKTNITGKLQIEIGDYLIDEVRDKYHLTFSFDEMDEITNKCIEVAKYVTGNDIRYSNLVQNKFIFNWIIPIGNL